MLWLLTKCMISHDYSSVTADQENSSLAVTGHWEILNWLTGSVNCDQSLLASPVGGGGGGSKFSLVKKDHDDAEFWSRKSVLCSDCPWQESGYDQAQIFSMPFASIAKMFWFKRSFTLEP